MTDTDWIDLAIKALPALYMTVWLVRIEVQAVSVRRALQPAPLPVVRAVRR